MVGACIGGVAQVLPVLSQHRTDGPSVNDAMSVRTCLGHEIRRAARPSVETTRHLHMVRHQALSSSAASRNVQVVSRVVTVAPQLGQRSDMYHAVHACGHNIEQRRSNAHGAAPLIDTAPKYPCRFACVFVASGPPPASPSGGRPDRSWHCVDATPQSLRSVCAPSTPSDAGSGAIVPVQRRR